MRLIHFAIAVTLLTTPLAAVAQDGPVVKNGEKALESVTMDLNELWLRGDETDDVFFGLPNQIIEDDAGNVYILDGQISEILVFDHAGEYLRTIGREGEGPGEFRNAGDMFLRPDGILGVITIFPGKITQITTTGEPAGMFPLPAAEGGGFQLVYKARSAGDRVIVAGAQQTNEGGAQKQANYLKAFDLDGEELAHYHTIIEESKYGGMKYDEKIFANFKGQWTVGPDGRVAASLSFDDYRIHVWNPDGSVKHIIERPDYAPHQRTAEEKDRMQKLFDGITRWNPDSEFKTSDTHRAIGQMWYRDDGTLWVLSGQGSYHRQEGVFGVFDVYDTDGKFVRKVTMRGEGDTVNDGVYFSGSRLYRVTDQFSGLMANLGGDTDEASGSMEPLQVVAYELDPAAVGSR